MLRSRVSGFRSRRTLGISAGLGLRVFRVWGFRAIRMLGISAGIGLSVFRVSGVIAIRMLGISAGLGLVSRFRTVRILGFNKCLARA